jgi:hypothetical protein
MFSMPAQNERRSTLPPSSKSFCARGHSFARLSEEDVAALATAIQRRSITTAYEYDYLQVWLKRWYADSFGVEVQVECHRLGRQPLIPSNRKVLDVIDLLIPTTIKRLRGPMLVRLERKDGSALLQRGLKVRCVVLKSRWNRFPVCPRDDFQKPLASAFVDRLGSLVRTRGFQKLVTPEYLAGKTRQSLGALQETKVRDSAKPLPEVDPLLQHVQELDRPSDRQTFQSKAFRPQVETFHSHALQHVDKHSQSIGSIQNSLNDFGVIELYSGYIDAPTQFQSAVQTINIKQVREENPGVNDRDPNIQQLRALFGPDITRAMFSLQQQIKQQRLPGYPATKYYFTVECFGLGQSANFDFWHLDRSILIKRSDDQERDRKRIPLSWLGFLYYSGLPTWCLVGGEVVNPAQAFPSSASNQDALLTWYEGNVWHAVPTIEESQQASQFSRSGRRMFLRFRVTEVNKQFWEPSEVEAQKLNDKVRKMPVANSAL